MIRHSNLLLQTKFIQKNEFCDDSFNSSIKKLISPTASNFFNSSVFSSKNSLIQTHTLLFGQRYIQTKGYTDLSSVNWRKPPPRLLNIFMLPWGTPASSVKLLETVWLFFNVIFWLLRKLLVRFVIHHGEVIWICFYKIQWIYSVSAPQLREHKFFMTPSRTCSFLT